MTLAVRLNSQEATWAVRRNVSLLSLQSMPVVLSLEFVPKEIARDKVRSASRVVAYNG